MIFSCAEVGASNIPSPTSLFKSQLYLKNIFVKWLYLWNVFICISVVIGSFGHTIKKYNSFGDLVQVLGTPGKKGTALNPLQFDNPAELYVEDTGDIYIVDGDGGLNNRLIKLSQGTWLNFNDII